MAPSATLRSKLISNTLKVAAEATAQPAVAAIGAAAVAGSGSAASLAAGLSSLFVGCLLMGSRRDAADHHELEHRLREFFRTQADVLQSLERLASEVPWVEATVQKNARALKDVLNSRMDEVVARLAHHESLALYVSNWLAAQGAGIERLLQEVAAKLDRPVPADRSARGEQRRLLLIKLKIPYDAWRDPETQKAIETLRLLAEDLELKLIRKHPGSLVLVIEVSERGAERLQSLEKAGAVSKALGAFVDQIAPTSAVFWALLDAAASIASTPVSQDSPPPRPSASARPASGTMKLYIGNLPFSATEQDLKRLLEAFGPATVTLVIDRDTGRSRGFAFAEMSREAGEAAIAALNGRDFMDRPLVLTETKPREGRDGGGRGGFGGGFSGRDRV